MPDFSHEKYDNARSLVRDRFLKNWPLEHVQKYPTLQPTSPVRPVHENLIGCLDSNDLLGQSGDLFTEKIWRDFVSYVYSKLPEYSPVILGRIDSPRRTIDQGCRLEGSRWMRYKSRLPWSMKAKDAFETETFGIFARMATRETPFKGLVVGRVQSGKTASMAGLIVLAADHEFNVIFVLSGLITNLMNQTQSRFDKEFVEEAPPSHGWRRLFSVSGVNELVFEQFSPNYRYFHVFLKNVNHFDALKNWLNSQNSVMREKMKILIIDDEADQASIQAGANATAINSAIVDLVHSQAAQGFAEICYVGYTATPWANVLSVQPSHNNGENLYPKDLVACLSTSPDYLGCEAFFGVENESEGIGYRKRIPDTEVQTISQIHDNRSAYVPNTMRKAFMWFVAAAAVRRHYRHNKPVTMLIHTSHQQNHHSALARCISENVKSWTKDPGFVEEICEYYDKEKTEISAEEFLDTFGGYSATNLGELPNGKDIKVLVRELISVFSSYKYDENGKLVVDSFHRGIHPCVDNSDEGAPFPRLEYADNLDAAYLVIGGNTLARGLTIEGLVSSWFLRDRTNAADTLMQMGRWFGYRHKYELLPRVWVTDRTKSRFRAMARLESDFRRRVKELEAAGGNPAESPLHILNDLGKKLSVTAANRRRAAISNPSHSGASPQTTYFNNENDIQERNLSKLKGFVAKLLNSYPPNSNELGMSRVVFRNVQWNDVQDFLTDLEYSDKGEWFPQVGDYLPILKNRLGQFNWNVMISGKEDGAECVLAAGFSIGKVQRSQYRKSPDGIIDIGTLRNPSDLVADIPEGFKRKGDTVGNLRKAAGVDQVPLLIIYVIDGKARMKKETEDRTSMDYPFDMVGVSILTPGERGAGNTLTVQAIEQEIRDGISDLEDEQVNTIDGDL